MKFHKKLLALGLIVTTISFFNLTAATSKNLRVMAVQNNTNSGTVTASTLMVRSGPGTSYGIIGKLKANDKVSITASQSGWYKIKYNSVEGYVSSSYIKISTEENTEEKQSGTITASSLNMRSGPSTNYGVIKVLYKGQQVIIEENQNGWLKVNSDNTAGWVSSAYVAGSNVSASNGTSSESAANTITEKVNKSVIVIDAGHGGYDCGAIGPKGTQEKAITLPVSLKLGEILEKQGHTIIYTRTSDKVTWPKNEKEDLRARVDIAKKSKADLYISIHCNSSETSYAKGMETYYTKGNTKSKLLAQYIQDNMVDNIKLGNRGIKDDNFYVIKYNTAVSVLVELAYISNPTEERLLNDPAYQNKWAESIAKGINSYLGDG